MAEIFYRDESFEIIGACFEVYNQKGFGFTEPIYQECLQHELSIRGIPFVSQPEVKMSYKGLPLNHSFRPDFVCYNKIILEIKATAALTDAFRAQLLNYLHATQFELGLLVNFGQFPKLVFERLVCNRRNSAATRYEVLSSGKAEF